MAIIFDKAAGADEVRAGRTRRSARHRLVACARNLDVQQAAREEPESGAGWQFAEIHPGPGHDRVQTAVVTGAATVHKREEIQRRVGQRLIALPISRGTVLTADVRPARQARIKSTLKSFVTAEGVEAALRRA